MTLLSERDARRNRLINRRALMLGLGKLGLFGALGARLYYLQVVEADRYRMLSEDNRINVSLLPPSRGMIVDRFGAPLAQNRQNFRLLLVEEQSPDVMATLRRIDESIGLRDDEIARVKREMERRRSFVPVTVRENLDWREVSRIEVSAPDLPGATIDVGEIRSYPLGEAAAHVVGYVGAVSERDMDDDPVLALPGFRVGKTGIERDHEALLRGRAGTRRVEVNAVGRAIREIDRREGQSGGKLRLTLDGGLQSAVQNRLAQERSGSAVILDVHNGAVYALCSHPAFDPNLFARGIPADVWQGLTSDPTAPLINKAIAGQYPPGSTFKMMTALAALQDGAVGPDHTVHCRGHVDLGGHRFHCWKRGGHGKVGFVEALAQSCDSFFYDIGRRVGIEAIAAMARRFGFDSETGLDLRGERPGLIPDKGWKLGHFGEPWQGGETLICAIGQGYVKATPLQLAVMTARLVNGGFTTVPHLVMRRDGQPVEQKGPPFPPLGLKPDALALILQGMQAVTNGARGTARGAQLRDPALAFGGKTGTAQVKRITLAERRAGIENEDLAWKFRHHALFVGYAPLHAPRYACAVVIEHGGSGSSTAAPIARDILREVQERNSGRLAFSGVSPSGTRPSGAG